MDGEKRTVWLAKWEVPDKLKIKLKKNGEWNFHV